MKYVVYILHSKKFDRFYKGQTIDIDKRLARHNAGKEKSTAPYRPWQLVWSTEKPSRSEAMKLEVKLKSLSKEHTKTFIGKYSDKGS